VVESFRCRLVYFVYEESLVKYTKRRLNDSTAHGLDQRWVCGSTIAGPKPSKPGEGRDGSAPPPVEKPRALGTNHTAGNLVQIAGQGQASGRDSQPEYWSRDLSADFESAPLERDEAHAPSTAGRRASAGARRGRALADS
jgi:hypothetical protein